MFAALGTLNVWKDGIKMFYELELTSSDAWSVGSSPQKVYAPIHRFAFKMGQSTQLLLLPQTFLLMTVEFASLPFGFSTHGISSPIC